MSQLVTNDGLVNQSLAECLSLVGVSEGLFVTNTSTTDGLNNNAPSLRQLVYYECNIIVMHTS